MNRVFIMYFILCNRFLIVKLEADTRAFGIKTKKRVFSLL